MYIPHQYLNEDLEEVREFLLNNAFAILVNTVDGRPWATHLPLELSSDPDGRPLLIGHVAKANPQWRSFKDGVDVLAIFNGPHSYVSSSWYKDEEVPTWNYIAVHVYGTIRVQDEARLYKSLDTLVEKYEKQSSHPVSMEGFSKRTLRQIKGVVGFEIDIKEIQAAYKLSQGRPHDHSSIIGELQKRQDPGSKSIAEEMKKRTQS